MLGLSFTIGQLPDCRRQPEPEFTKRHWGVSASASMERVAPPGRVADANPTLGLGRALSGAQLMRIRHSNTGAEFAAELTTEHWSAAPGQPMVVVDGKALEASEFEVIECTERELSHLPRPWVTTLLDAL